MLYLSAGKQEKIMSAIPTSKRPKVLLEIHQDIVEGRLVIPVLPAVAIRVRDSSNDPDQGIAELAQLIQADTALTAYLLQVANSSFFSRVNKSKTLLQAVNQLGQSRTRDLAISYCIKTLYASQIPAVKDILRRQWERSTYIASIASILASHCKGMDPQRALLAGLLQDIGSLPVIEKMATYFTEVNSDDVIYDTLSRTSSVVGAIVLEKWKFDSDLIEVVSSREKWQRKKDEMDLADVILVARLHSYIGTDRMKKLPKLNEISAFDRLNLKDNAEMTPDFSLAIIEDAREDLKELQKNLL